MATTIEQQVVLDETLVPSTQRLRIGRSNFRLPSDIQSKKSTLQVVYDVLRRCPFFKAFLVTTDEFWATVYVHQDSIRFKMDNKRHIVNLETFRDMLHICPRIPGQSFNELPFEDEILEFLRDDMIFSTIKVVSRHQNTQQYGAMLPLKLTNDKIRNTKAYKEYYACATGEAAPKPKASARRKRSGSDPSITPPTAITTPTTTVAVTPRLTAATDISQLGGSGTDEGTSSKPGVPDVPSDDSEEELSWNSSDDEDTDAQEKDRDDDEGDEKDESDDREEDNAEDKDCDKRDDDDDQEIAKTDEQDDAERGRDDDEENESDEESNGDETREEESFDPILRTPEDSEDDDHGEEDQGLRISEEERLNKEEEADELYRDVDINQGRGLQLSQDIEDSHVTLTPVNLDGQQESSSVLSQFVTSMLNPTSDACMESIFATASFSVAPLQTSTPIMTLSTIATITTISHAPIPPMTIPSEVKGQVKEQVSRILPRIEQSVNAQLEAEVLTRSSHSSRTSYAVAADLSEMELRKILIEKMQGNKSIQRSDEQRNLYKALVEAYEADKIILDIYGETVTLKRRRDDESDKDEGPSAGSDRGSKRRREGAEDQPIVQSFQHPEWFSQPKKPPTPDRDWNKTLPAVQGSTQTWISKLAKQVDSRSSFNELLDTPLDFSNFIMNRLSVDTLTPELLAGPTFDLMKGSCTSLIELEYHLEEVYKVTTDQLDWVNPEGQQYPYNLLQLLPLIPNNRDYGNIKWIEDLVPRSMWIQESINYDKHALWGVSHWGRKRQQFYGFAVNQESALDVYSKRRIIAITDLKIVEWHSNKHLDRITVRRDDDKLYKFKEGDFKRLCLQDIEDMLLLLRRVEDLQLGVESYQKRLNFTKPDTYRSDLKRREAYIAYSNPKGFIYQNKDKKNSYRPASRPPPPENFSGGLFSAKPKMLLLLRSTRSIETLATTRRHHHHCCHHRRRHYSLRPHPRPAATPHHLTIYISITPPDPPSPPTHSAAAYGSHHRTTSIISGHLPLPPPRPRTPPPTETTPPISQPHRRH
nr:hypothetical protein [Tanacetum cinerariifolium]